MLKVAIDIDGVISSNPDFWKWLVYQLTKKPNNVKVFIVSARNPNRLKETENDLLDWGIRYDELITMPKEAPRSFKYQAIWKIAAIKEIEADIWVDDDFKIFKQTLGIDVWKELPNVNLVLI